MNATSDNQSGSKSRNGPGKAGNDELSAEIAALRRDIDAVTERLGKVAGAGARTARSRRDETSKMFRAKSDEFIDDLNHQLERIERQTSATVRRHPIQTMAIAAGAGFLAALLMRR
ncbi:MULTISPECIES: hypothetical protein [unclassified Roseitalea]|uniref:hypothetical protein n=1 Tax=unclassified Roseitalea TaxID=2639107 RepID=UPI00273E72FD|nr:MULTISPECIES: hypothetical protein [unclassified Roseitalea]